MKYLELDNYITKLTEGRCIRIIQIKYSYRCEYNIFLFGCDHDYYEYLLNELSNILVNIKTNDFDEDKINSILYSFHICLSTNRFLSILSVISAINISFKNITLVLSSIFSENFSVYAILTILRHLFSPLMYKN